MAGIRDLFLLAVCRTVAVQVELGLFVIFTLGSAPPSAPRRYTLSSGDYIGKHYRGY